MTLPGPRMKLRIAPYAPVGAHRHGRGVRDGDDLPSPQLVSQLEGIFGEKPPHSSPFPHDHPREPGDNKSSPSGLDDIPVAEGPWGGALISKEGDESRLDKEEVGVLLRQPPGVVDKKLGRVIVPGYPRYAIVWRSSNKDRARFHPPRRPRRVWCACGGLPQ